MGPGLYIYLNPAQVSYEYRRMRTIQIYTYTRMTEDDSFASLTFSGFPGDSARVSASFRSARRAFDTVRHPAETHMHSFNKNFGQRQCVCTSTSDPCYFLLPDPGSITLASYNYNSSPSWSSWPPSPSPASSPSSSSISSSSSSSSSSASSSKYFALHGHSYLNQWSTDLSRCKHGQGKSHGTQPLGGTMTARWIGCSLPSFARRGTAICLSISDITCCVTHMMLALSIPDLQRGESGNCWDVNDCGDITLSF